MSEGRDQTAGQSAVLKAVVRKSWVACKNPHCGHRCDAWDLWFWWHYPDGSVHLAARYTDFNWKTALEWANNTLKANSRDR